jgi:hypothetical protein
LGGIVPNATETLTGVKIMATERKAILQVGHVFFVTDVSTAIVLEEKLVNLLQVDTHFIDPDDHPDVEPNGLVYTPCERPSLLDVKLVERRHSVVTDPEWYPAFRALTQEEYES